MKTRQFGFIQYAIKFCGLLPLCVILALFAACASQPGSSNSCGAPQAENSASPSAAKSGYDVAAIVWPAYHPEPRWKELGIFPHGTGEWQNVYEAKPKFEGHRQPIVPLWGYENEADPVAVARKIDAALAAGINVFMYDWYWYRNRPFLEGALNDGFLKAPNNERMKFFLMWANHDVNNLWNNKIGGPEKKKVNWSADVSYDEFTKVLAPRFMEYFKKPNYYKIGNKPVLAVFQMRNFVRGAGGPERAKAALDFLDSECKKAGFAGLHFMSMNVPGGVPVPGKERASLKEVAEYYGFNSMSCYNWTGSKKGGYAAWRDRNMPQWEKYKNDFGVFFPIVSTGWDNNPRYPQDEFTEICEGKSPEEYEKTLRMAKAWADKNIPAGSPKLIFINAWNEWTEGEYLEPDSFYGYGYLNATARVFGGSGQSE